MEFLIAKNVIGTSNENAQNLKRKKKPTRMQRPNGVEVKKNVEANKINFVEINAMSDFSLLFAKNGIKTFLIFR